MINLNKYAYTDHFKRLCWMIYLWMISSKNNSDKSTRILHVYLIYLPRDKFFLSVRISQDRDLVHFQLHPTYPWYHILSFLLNVFKAILRKTVDNLNVINEILLYHHSFKLRCFIPKVIFFIKKCTRNVKQIMQTTLIPLAMFLEFIFLRTLHNFQARVRSVSAVKLWVLSKYHMHLCVHHGTFLCGFFFYCS